jgi:hypothetical protein
MAPPLRCRLKDRDERQYRVKRTSGEIENDWLVKDPLSSSMETLVHANGDIMTEAEAGQYIICYKPWPLSDGRPGEVTKAVRVQDFYRLNPCYSRHKHA